MVHLILRSLVQQIGPGVRALIRRVFIFAILLRLDSMGAASVSWDGGAGTTSWHDAANWVGDRLPADGDSVTIATGSRVVYSEGVLKLASLNAAVDFEIRGGNLELPNVTGAGNFTGGVRLLGGSLTGGTFKIRNGSYFAGAEFVGGAHFQVLPGTTILYGQLSTNVTITIVSSERDGGHGYLKVPVGTTATNRGVIRFGSDGRYVAGVATSETVGDKLSVFVNEGKLVGASGALVNQVVGSAINFGEVSSQNGGQLTVYGSFLNRGGSIVTEGTGFVEFRECRLDWADGAEINGDVRIRDGSLKVSPFMRNPSRIVVRPGTTAFLNQLSTNVTITIVSSERDGGHGFLKVPVGTTATNRGIIRFVSDGRYVARVETSETVGDKLSVFVNEGKLVGASGALVNQVVGSAINFGEVSSQNGGQLTVYGSFLNRDGSIVTEGTGFVEFRQCRLEWDDGAGINGEVRIRDGSLKVSPFMRNPSRIVVRPGTTAFLNQLSTNLNTVIYAYNANEGGNAFLKVPVATTATNRGVIHFVSDGAYVARVETSETVGDKLSIFVNEGKLVGASATLANQVVGTTVNFGDVSSQNGGQLTVYGSLLNRDGSIVTQGTGFVEFRQCRLEWDDGAGINGEVRIRDGSLKVSPFMRNPSRIVVRPGTTAFLNQLSTNLNTVIYGYNANDGGNAFLKVPVATTATNRGAVHLVSDGAYVARLETSESVEGKESLVVNEGQVIGGSSATANQLYANLLNRGEIWCGTGAYMNVSGHTRMHSGRIYTAGTGSLVFENLLELMGGTIQAEHSGRVELRVSSLRWLGGRFLPGAVQTSGSLFVGDGVSEASELTVRNSHVFLGNHSVLATIRLGGSLSVLRDSVAVQAGTLLLDGALGNSTLSIADGGILSNSGSIIGSGGSHTISGGWNNDGLVELNNSTLTFGPKGYRFNNRGSMVLNPGNVAMNGVVFRNHPDGWITGFGSLNIGSGEFLHEGYLDPARSEGGLSIQGNFNPMPESTLVIDINAYQALIDRGHTPGVTYDLLRVSGTATLNGGLQIRLANDPATGMAVLPTLGDGIPFLTATAVTGSFSRTNSLQLSVDRSLELEYLAREVRARARPADNNQALAIIRQPQSQRVRLDVAVFLEVGARGTPPLRFRWYRNGNPVPGGTNAVLSVGAMSLEAAGQYQVVVFNDGGFLRSDVVTLDVELPPVFLTDRFADRLTYRDASFIGVTNNRSATVEAGEPRHALKTGGKSMWMTWLAPATGIATFRTRGSSFDTLLAIYRGKELATLANDEMGHDEDSAGFLTSEVSFSAVEGTEYEVAVDGLAGASGDLVMSWSLRSDGLVVPRIRRHPESKILLAGAVTKLDVDAEGPDLRYQWYRNGLAVAGATGRELTITDFKVADVGTYRVGLRSGGGPEVRSDPAEVAMVTEEVSRVGFRDKLEDLLEPAPVGGRPQGPLDSFASLALLKPGSLQINNSLASVQPAESACVAEEDGASMWWRIRPTEKGLLVLDTFGSGRDTVLGIYGWNGGPQLLGCDDDSNPVEGTSKVQVNVEAGRDYFVRVDTVNGRGAIRLNWQLKQGVLETPAEFRAALKLETGEIELEILANPGRIRIESSTNLRDWKVVTEMDSLGKWIRHREKLEATGGSGGRFFRMK